jgi:hypothetical protein
VLAAGLTAFLAVGGVATPAGAAGGRDLAVEAAVRPVAVRPSSLTIVARLDRADATYAAGEAVRLAVRTSEDAFVTVFAIGASGRVIRLFPNALQPDNRVSAGADVAIPAPGGGVALRVAAPFGREALRIVATTRPVPVLPDGRLGDRAGLFQTVRGGAAALVRDLQAVADGADARSKVAVVAIGLRTVATRPAAASAPFMPPPPVRPLAADRTTDRVGAPVTLSPPGPCRLRVVAIDAVARLGRAQTVIVSDGPAPRTLAFDASGRAETVAPGAAPAVSDAEVAVAGGAVRTAEGKAALDRAATRAGRPAEPRVGVARFVLAVRP